MLVKLAWQSLLNRRGSVALTLASITISVMIVLGVEHIRSQARDSFNRTVSGVDLIVGARTGQINLLLSSVFRIGNATNTIRWESYELIAGDSRVAWSIPLAMGDSHRGYRVLGTNEDYFRHYRYGQQRELAFTAGAPFDHDHEAVLGAEVAQRLGYTLNDELILSHGLGEISFTQHDDHPFAVVGILAPTGTPVDQTIHIPLAGMSAMHEDMPGMSPGAPPTTSLVSQGPSPAPADDHDHDDHPQELEGPDIEAINAIMLGLNNRLATFPMQRLINEYTGEPLLAILPGVALAELWELMGVAENILFVVAVLVMVASLLGLATLLLSSMAQRRQEIALFRAIGMHSLSILFLIELEALLVSLLGIALGWLTVAFGLRFGQDWLSREYGLFVSALPLSETIIAYLLLILVAAAALALLPAAAAYRSSLGHQLGKG